MTALDKLIEAVEAGTSDRQGLLHMIDKAMPQGNRGCMAMAHQAYHGSLDAALALHEALLPGWRWDLDAACNAGVWNSCDLLPAIAGEANTPARAWLLAILRAYRSVQA